MRLIGPTIRFQRSAQARGRKETIGVADKSSQIFCCFEKTTTPTTPTTSLFRRIRVFDFVFDTVVSPRLSVRNWNYLPPILAIGTIPTLRFTLPRGRVKHAT